MLSKSKHLLIAATAIVLVTGFTTSSHATPTPVQSFSFTDQAGTLNNIVNIGVSSGSSQPTTIIQGVNGSNNTAGLGFTESGLLNITNANLLNGPPFSVSIPSTGPLVINYSLSGVANLDGSITFNTGGSIFLTEGATTIASFSVVAPSGSTGSNFTNINSITAGIVQLTLEQNPGGLVPNVFTSSTPGFILELANITPSFNAPTIGACPEGDATFAGAAACATITTSAEGGNISAAIPEPGSLALIGGSLFALGLIRRRKSAAA